MVARSMLIIGLFVSVSAQAQRFVSEHGWIKFYSQAAIEDITAKNEKPTALFDASAGTIAFVVPINQFVFAKSLMQYWDFSWEDLKTPFPKCALF